MFRALIEWGLELAGPDKEGEGKGKGRGADQEGETVLKKN